jgi:hypothetical protein
VITFPETLLLTVLLGILTWIGHMRQTGKPPWMTQFKADLTDTLARVDTALAELWTRAADLYSIGLIVLTDAIEQTRLVQAYEYVGRHQPHLGSVSVAKLLGIEGASVNWAQVLRDMNEEIKRENHARWAAIA